MKTFNITLYLCLFLLGSLGFQSCDSTDGPAIDGKITLSQPSYSVAHTGGEVTITVTVTPSNLDWVAESDDNWITVPQESQTATTFVISVPEWNEPADEPRTGTVTVKAAGAEPQKVTVQQQPDKFEPFLILDDSDIEFPIRASEHFVEVESNVLWEAKTEANWITIFPSADGFNVKVTANETSKHREDVITVSTANLDPKTIRVTQEFTAPVLEIDIDQRELSYNYSKIENRRIFTINSNIPYKVTLEQEPDATGDDTWARIDEDFNDYKNILLRLWENGSGDSRTATVTVSAEEEDLHAPIVVKITQRKLNIVDGPRFQTGDDVVLVSDGENITYEVTLPAILDGTYHLNMEPVPTGSISLKETVQMLWLTYVYSAGYGRLELDVTDNGTTEPRSGEMEVYTHPDEDSRGMTTVKLSQVGLEEEPDFGETYESFFGRYTLTATQSDGSPWTQEVVFAKYEGNPWNNGVSQAYKVTPVYEYYNLAGKYGEPCMFFLYTDGKPARVNTELIDTGKVYFDIPGSSSFNTQQGSNRWIVYDARGWIEPAGDHIVNYLCISLQNILDYNPEMILDKEAKTLSFPADTFTWNSSMDQSYQTYDGNPIYLSFGYKAALLYDFRPYKGIRDITFTYIGPAE